MNKQKGSSGVIPSKRYEKKWYGKAMFLLEGYLNRYEGETEREGVFGRMFLIPFFYADGIRPHGRPSKRQLLKEERIFNVQKLFEKLRLSEYDRERGALPKYCADRMLPDYIEFEKNRYYKATDPFLLCFYRITPCFERRTGSYDLFEAVIVHYADVLRVMFESAEDRKELQNRVRRYQDKPNVPKGHSEFYRQWMGQHHPDQFQCMALLIFDQLLYDAFQIAEHEARRKDDQKWKSLCQRVFTEEDESESGDLADTTPSAGSIPTTVYRATSPAALALPDAVVVPRKVFHLLVRGLQPKTFSTNELTTLVEFLESGKSGYTLEVRMLAEQVDAILDVEKADVWEQIQKGGINQEADTFQKMTEMMISMKHLSERVKALMSAEHSQ